MDRPQAGFFLERGQGIRTYSAFLPPPLPPNPPLDYSGNLPRLIGDAAHALGMLGSLIGNPDISRLIGLQNVRREAVLSSQIEGAHSSVADSLLFPHLSHAGETRDEDAEIENCVDAMLLGLQTVSAGTGIDRSLLCRLHAILLPSGRGRARNPGRFRSRQNWVGGIGPVTAEYVPPPPGRVAECMRSLEQFISSSGSDMHPLIRTGLAHAQFESIHPFEDGNGRIGRLLMLLMLIRDDLIPSPVLCLSQHFRSQRPAYYHLLNRTRLSGDWESWLGFFLEGIVVAANHARQATQRRMAVFEEDAGLLESRSRSALAARVHRFLFARPVASIAQIRTEIHASFPGIANALAKLQALGIISAPGTRKRNRYFVYDRCLAILDEGT